MRIRSVKPDFWRDEVTGLMDTDVALFYIGMACYADDYGRFVWSSTLIHADLDPFGKKWGGLEGINAMLDKLLELGRIVKYESQGRRYGAIPNQRRHQKPNRPTASRLPQPPAGLTEGSLSHHGAITDGSQPDHVKSSQERSGSGVEWGAETWLDPTLAPPPDNVVLEIPCLGVYDETPDSYAIRESQIREWQEAFPGVDIPAALRKARIWVNAKKDNLKTHKGMPTFILRWLSTEQNRRSSPRATTPKRSDEEVREQEAQERFNAVVSRTVSVKPTFASGHHDEASPRGDGGAPPADGPNLGGVPEAGGADEAAVRGLLGDRWETGIVQDSFSVEHGAEHGRDGEQGAVRLAGDVPGVDDAVGAVAVERSSTAEHRGLPPARGKGPDRR